LLCGRPDRTRPTRKRVPPVADFTYAQNVDISTPNLIDTSVMALDVGSIFQMIALAWHPQSTLG
jgi:hypothetical protein